MIEQRKKVGIIVAMDKELDLFIKEYKTEQEKYKGFTFYYVRAYNETTDLIIVKSGIGKVNAAIATTLLVSMYSPNVIITTGVCGSLATEEINQGDIHITSIVRYHDVWCGVPNVPGQVQDMPSYFKLVQHSDSALIKSIKNQFQKTNRNVWWGPTVSGDWFVDNLPRAREFNHLYNHLPGPVAVDMEIGAIAQTAHLFKTRLIAVKIVSDVILNHDCKRYEEFWTNAGDVLHITLKAVLDSLELIDLTFTSKKQKHETNSVI